MSLGRISLGRVSWRRLGCIRKILWEIKKISVLLFSHFFLQFSTAEFYFVQIFFSVSLKPSPETLPFFFHFPFNLSFPLLLRLLRSPVSVSFMLGSFPEWKTRERKIWGCRFFSSSLDDEETSQRDETKRKSLLYLIFIRLVGIINIFFSWSLQFR